MTVTSRPRTITRAALLACLSVGGCGMFSGGAKPDPVALSGSTISTETVALGNSYGLNLPKRIDGFVRTDTEDRPHGTDIVAGYARTLDPAPIIATVRVHKVGDPGTLSVLTGSTTNATTVRSQAALGASIAQVRRFYPDASVVRTAAAYLVRFGAMQTGRTATLTYTDVMDGVRQPIALRVVTFCCADGRWNYEYRFRYPASLAGVDGPIAKFLDDLAWSAEPSASVDKPD